MKRKLAAANVVTKEQSRLKGQSAASLTEALQAAEQSNAHLTQRNATLEHEASNREARAQAQLAAAGKSGPALARLQRGYDRLCAAFSSKCAALTTVQDAREASHAEFRQNLKTITDKAVEEVAAAENSGGKKKKDQAADKAAAPSVKELSWNTMRSDFETQIAETGATMTQLRQDCAEQQASADTLRATFYQGQGGQGATQASDPAVMALTAADFKPTHASSTSNAGGAGADAGEEAAPDSGAGTGLGATAASTGGGGGGAATSAMAVAAISAAGQEDGGDGAVLVAQNQQFRAGLVELIE